MLSPTMRKMLIYVGIFFAIIFGWYGVKKVFFFLYMLQYQPPAVTISATEVKATTWQSYLTAVGTLTAINGVDITAEAPGIVKEIRFTSGQYVQQGQTLALLDTNVEEAQLKDNQAKLKLAQIDYDRNKKLFQKNVVAQSTLDTSYAQLQQAEAGVELVQAKIKQKTITAPFSGKIGIRLVDIGQYISPGNAIVSLQSLSPLYVQFNLPEQYLPHLYLQQPVDVQVNFANGKAVQGVVTAINSKVDQVTRNILVQATISNENLELYPGMYAFTKTWLKEQKNVMTVPETAISYSLHGDYVFLIKEQGKNKKHPVLTVSRQYVKVGEHRDNQVAILEGLKPHDKIVTSGQLKLQNGSAVAINNSVEI